MSHHDGKLGGKVIVNGFIKTFSDNEQLSEVENGKIPLPARWQFGVFGGPKKAYAGFPVWMGKNDNLSLLAALKADFPTNWEAFRQICRTMITDVCIVFTRKQKPFSPQVANEGSGWQVIHKA